MKYIIKKRKITKAFVAAFYKSNFNNAFWFTINPDNTIDVDNYSLLYPDRYILPDNFSTIQVLKWCREF